ncbi:MAG: tripartite tricarboxylate transporter substrate binding protein, partial [Burkholderiales bacterium]
MLSAVSLSYNAAAQPYPSKFIRLVVPYVPGGGTDTLSRLIGPRMGDNLSQQVVIDNRAGGGSVTGTAIVAKAPADGYTLAIVDTSFTTNPTLYSSLPYDPVKDFAPVSLVAAAPVILVVHPSVPARNTKEFLALARAKPGSINIASGAIGSSTHLGCELFKLAAKVDVVNIPYKGTGQAISDVLGGQVGAIVAGVSTVRQHVEAGRLRAIAVTGPERVPAIREVPTFIESGLKGVDSGTYWGILAPAGTPKDIVAKLNTAITATVKSPEVRPKMEDRGYTVIGGTPEQFADNIRTEIAKWAKV